MMRVEGVLCCVDTWEYRNKAEESWLPCLTYLAHGQNWHTERRGYYTHMGWQSEEEICLGLQELLVAQ